MTPQTLIMAVATVWILSHTVAREIPITAAMPKPFSCQYCMSVWILILAGLITALADLAGQGEVLDILEAGTIWTGSVFLEAAYDRLKTIIL